MPFSSYLTNTRRGTTSWARSLLPSTATATTPTSKSKLSSRKSRKRTLFINFLFANFVTIALSLSLFFFLLTLLVFGIPEPISSHFKSKPTRLYKPRKPLYRNPDNAAVSHAKVDITTKALYDKIEFLDIDGGPWKQGWRVNYKGDEWDNEKLKIFVVPHSHNDPGWKLTVEEYYERQSRHILDTIVDTLSKDVRRKFIWEEMSYLERWWRDTSVSKRESFINLVKNGQLEIVGGGWVMNDEANSHYFAIIEQVNIFNKLDWKCSNGSALFQSYLEEMRVFKFLIGLNDSLDEVCGRILSTKPLPSVREVVSEVRREDSCKKIML